MAEKAQGLKEFSEINALFQRVRKHNPPQADIDELKKYLVKYPNLSTIAGDLLQSVQQHIIEDAFPLKTAAPIAVSVEAYCELQRNELGYKTATPIERSLIENVVLCWLRLHLCEHRYQSSMEKNISLTQAMYWEKKLSANQKRYLRAVETLARVRKMTISVQINMAHQQIVTG